MNSRKRIVIVAKKIIEFVRDWRTIVALVLIPLFFSTSFHRFSHRNAK